MSNTTAKKVKQMVNETEHTSTRRVCSTIYVCLRGIDDSSSHLRSLFSSSFLVLENAIVFCSTVLSRVRCHYILSPESNAECCARERIKCPRLSPTQLKDDQVLTAKKAASDSRSSTMATRNVRRPGALSKDELVIDTTSTDMNYQRSVVEFKIEASPSSPSTKREVQHRTP